ncbi:MAG: putative zinc-binding metallopeptidase [Bacteroidales bacterium]|nr:putative zinc-binding metallopeptidase [Bacteroidales bacterium]
MTKFLKYIAMALVAMSFIACEEKPLDPTSQIIDSKLEQNEFDKWLVTNYIEPYNIMFKYRMEKNESDFNYWLVPATYENSIKMAKLMKFLCFEPYDELTGSKEFIKSYYPKMIHLVGSGAYRNDGTFVLGTAEGGLKITMYFVNEMVIDPAYLNEYYFKTMHHEFAHILNQIKPYSTDFNAISGPDYVTDTWSDAWASEREAQQNGFISEYASSEHGEDFVELLSIYVTNTPEYWDNVLKNAGAGAEKINAKFEIVYNYMLNSWNIDLNELRDIIQRRQGEIDTLDLETLN